MKFHPLILTPVLALGLALNGCDRGHDHDHDDHDHEEHADHESHDHDEFGEDHHHEENVEAGPNGGHVIHSGAGVVLEVVVNDQRHAVITRLNESLEPVAAGNLSLHGVAGERTDPVELDFEADGDVLVSDKPLPEDAHVPMILVIRSAPDAQEATERFELHIH